MRIGIDLGGTKIEIIALDDNGAVCLQRRVPTPQGDYNATLHSIQTLVQQAEAQLGCGASVGLAIPGSISPLTGLMRNANSTCLNGHPLQQDLQQRLQRPLRLANDANCLALSEATDGAAAGAASVFAVIVGTGCGAGLVVNGQVLQGANGIAGEWGHNPLPWPGAAEYPGERCWCGLDGCIETWLSGSAFARNYARRGAALLSAEVIVQRAQQGEALALACLEDYSERMAKSLAQVINVFDPDVIVLGGGMSNVAALYSEVPARWQKYVFSDVVQTRLLAPQFGDSSGVRGAAWLGATVSGDGVAC